MEDLKTYSCYAVLQELNRREFRKKLDLFAPELRHCVILAAGIIGAETAKRVDETPEAVVRDSEHFTAELIEMVSPAQDDAFQSVLETCLIETMKGELRFCCSNCLNFNACIDLESLSVGHLFKLRAEGQDSDELKREIAFRIDQAFQKAPYLETDNAHTLCRDFRHQYTASAIGSLFSRYADIAAGLQHSFGLDYRKIQQEMISLNMDFYAKSEDS